MKHNQTIVEFKIDLTDPCFPERMQGASCDKSKRGNQTPDKI
jgi:hypothetical protein